MAENRRADDKIAKAILGELDRTVVPKMKENGSTVKEFVDQLQNEIKKPKSDFSPLKGATVIHGGSAYEGLAVNKEVDFDLYVILGKPYLSENFIVHREPNKFFTLEWRPNVLHKDCLDADGYLNVAKLRRQLFDEIKECIKEIKLFNCNINNTEGTAALLLEIVSNCKCQKISIDLVPHIAFHSWGQCPDLRPKHDMPEKLKKYIDILEANASPTLFFSLAPPYVCDDQRICNISFSLLEKRFVTSDIDVRSMVRLVKFVGDRCDWKKKYSFQSYFAKRMAVKHYDTLKDMDLWDGYKMILQCLCNELNSGTVDGYFIKNQVTYMKDMKVAAKLQWAINDSLAKSAIEIKCLI